jgi:hypothetical protein
MVRRSEARSSGSPEAPDRLYEGYVFDLDGTIYLGDELLPGAKRLILKLRELGKRVIFLSNNPTKDPTMYAEKLGKLGLKTPASEIVNTVVTMTRWLLSNHPEATVFPISEEPLKNSRSEAGIRISENPEEIDIVIASYDRGFDYRKLQIARVRLPQAPDRLRRHLVLQTGDARHHQPRPLLSLSRWQGRARRGSDRRGHRGVHGSEVPGQRRQA